MYQLMSLDYTSAKGHARESIICQCRNDNLLRGSSILAIHSGGVTMSLFDLLDEELC